jgi:hypothetical protein
MTLRKFIACAQLMLLVLGLSLTTGCNGDEVTITYRQVANWNQFDDYNTSEVSQTDQGAPAIYVMYKITSIQNNSAKAKDFSFKVNDAYAYCLYPANVACPGVWSDEQQYGTLSNKNLLYHAKDQIVKAGTSATNLGCVILLVPASDPKTNTLSLVDLHWHNEGNPQFVNITREDTNTTVPFAFPMTSTTLNQLCTSSS